MKTIDATSERRSVNRGCVFSAAALTFLALGSCCISTSLLNEAMFTQTVDLKRMGWRFEAKYDVFFGVTTKSSKLSYNGKDVGVSLPKPLGLVTPIGEFHSDLSEWDAVWSNPPIWSDKYRTSNHKDGAPWVWQVDHSRDVQQFLERGFYQVPRRVKSFGIPWTDQQLTGTPAHWVYVYRLSWPDPNNTDYRSHAVTGYWVDPVHLDDLDWE